MRTKSTVKQNWGWLKALIEMNLHNQSHWWIIPASLFFYGAITVIQISPYQATHNWFGDGSLILFSNNKLRLFTLNPIYLFIVANIGSRYQWEEFALYRVGSRQHFWLAKSIIFVTLTIGYLGLVILCAEIAFLPFITEYSQGWSDTILGYFDDNSLPFVATHTPSTVWMSTMWFALLSWFALGGVVFVIAQITNRAGYGFGIALAISLIGSMIDMIPLSSWIQALSINRPMFSFWSGKQPMAFEAATLYWSVWYIILIFISVRHIYNAGGLIHNHSQLRAGIRGAWHTIHLSFGKIWLFAIVFSIISTLANRYIVNMVEINSLNLPVDLRPVLGLSGPSLEAPLFSFAFLRWISIFLIFLFAIGETSARSLWWQHSVLLPRLGSRRSWWLSNVCAISLLSFLYLLFYLGLDWVINREAFPSSSWLFYISIFMLYWLTLVLLGCSQLIILLITRSRSRTLLIMTLIFTFAWFAARNFPELLQWLPLAQTSIIAHLLSSGAIDTTFLLFNIFCGSIISILIGLVLIHRYEFANFLKHS